jgi:hypothetical protein
MLTRRARGLLDVLVPEHATSRSASDAIMSFGWTDANIYGISWGVVYNYCSSRDYNHAALFINANINENATFEPTCDVVHEPVVRKEYTGIRKDVYDFCIFAGISNQPENLDFINKFIEEL